MNKHRCILFFEVLLSAYFYNVNYQTLKKYKSYVETLVEFTYQLHKSKIQLVRNHPPRASIDKAMLSNGLSESSKTRDSRI